MGALLCSAVSGESPFRRDSLGGIPHAVLEGDIRPPAQAAPILPASDLWSFGVVLYAATEGVLGRKTLVGLGAAVVTAAVAAYLVISDPFVGPLPDGWERGKKGGRRRVAGGAAGLCAGCPQPGVGQGATLYKKSEDSLNEILGSAGSEAYQDADGMEKTDDAAFSSMAETPAPQAETTKTPIRPWGV
jgi:hypothetical protein